MKRDKDWIRDRNRAVGIAIGILALCAIVMILYPVVFSGASDGDMFALGQLVLEAALIPVAVIGFWYAAQEFRKAQQYPKLYLTWEDEALDDVRESVVYRKKIDLLGTEPTKKINRKIALYNSGDNIAIWYSVAISLPVGMTIAQDIPQGWDANLMGLSGFYGTAGTKENWISKNRPSTIDSIFQSNGTVASYPQQKLTLGAVKFRPVPEQDKVEQKYVIRYTIYTDKGVSRADNLTMKVIWTDKDPIIG